MRILLRSLLLVSLLAAAGCAATGPNAITHPDLNNRLISTAPVVVVTPLATVYWQGRDDLSEVDARASARLGRRLSEALRTGLERRGWQVDQSPQFDWQGLEAGGDLAAMRPASPEPESMTAARFLQELDRIGQGLRVNERIEGVRRADCRVTVPLPAAVEQGHGSSLWAVAFGCDGRLDDGPCRTIQVPPLHIPEPSSLPFAGGPVPFGMAIYLYWVDNDNGELLWYDDVKRFNLDPSSTADAEALVEQALQEFPANR